MKKIDILLIGPMPIDSSKIIKRYRHRKKVLTIFVDGGLVHRKSLSKLALKSSISLGDADSIPTRYRGELDILLDQEKDISDLGFALKAITKCKINIHEIALFGFSTNEREKRFDHLICNLGEVLRFVEKNQISTTIDDCYSFFSKGRHHFNHKGIFSVITFARNKISLTGECNFQLKSKTTIEALSSYGLSNIGLGKVTISCEKPVLIYLSSTTDKKPLH